MTTLPIDSGGKTTFTWFCCAAVTLFLISLAPTSAFVSSIEGPSVAGDFQIVSDKGSMRHVEFHATRSPDGLVTGEAVFRDDPVVNAEKSIENPSDESAQTFFFKAQFDCLVINKNEAIMSGVITESSLRPYVGRRVLVVAQDNGGAKDPSKRDRLTWGIYRSEQKQWATSDSERPDEQDNQRSWIASDSERPDDEGVLSDNKQVVGCQSFPLSSFSFSNGNQVRGTVFVRQ